MGEVADLADRGPPAARMGLPEVAASRMRRFRRPPNLHQAALFHGRTARRQPWAATSSEKARGIPDRVIYYQYRHDRCRRTLRGIDDQVTKAERAVEGKAPVKRNRYLRLSGATKSVNRELEAKARGLAGWKGYTNLTNQPAEFVINAYHQLWRIEKSFRMSKHDL